ncbi:hypothetical protein BD413DRAFT_125249 [Trametes elegans]|nr:hypothetical protein BD413DRAFT_125249 [Trametes elegans]
MPVLASGYERRVSPQVELQRSMGAVLVGSLVALFLSGAASMQTILYWQLYPSDPIHLKVTVFLIWLLDIVHSSMAITANWQYLILHFGDWDHIDNITWSIATTVALTAMITFIVHCFFTLRIHTLSRHNWYITTLLVALALVRLVSAFVSTSEMIRLQSYAQFVERYDYVFTIGLSTAASLDILIATALCYFLRRGRSAFSTQVAIRAVRLLAVPVLTRPQYGQDRGRYHAVHDRKRHADQVGAVPPRSECVFHHRSTYSSITTVISLICWVTMPMNLIFLGLHFAIGKLYANSLLATLNARKSLLHKSHGSSDRGEHALPVLFPDSFGRRTELINTQWSNRRSQADSSPAARVLQVNIQKTVQHEIDGEPALPPDSPALSAASDVDSPALSAASDVDPPGDTAKSARETYVAQ